MNGDDLKHDLTVLVGEGGYFTDPDEDKRLVEDVMKLMADRRIDRPNNSVWIGVTYKIPVVLVDRDDSSTPQIGAMYVTVNGVEGKPLEVFVNVGKQGGDASLMTDCIARLVSGWLQEGVETKRVLKHMINMKGHSAVGWGLEQTMVTSIPDGIGKAIQRYERLNGVEDGLLRVNNPEASDGPLEVIRSELHEVSEPTPVGKCLWCEGGKDRDGKGCGHCYGKGSTPSATHVEGCQQCKRMLVGRRSA